MIINRSNIFEILKEFGLRPEKDYGQNFLIDDGKEVILSDTGMPNETPDMGSDPNMPLSMGKKIATFKEAFEAAGYKVEDVTKIVVTHKHPDHTGELRTFPNAKIYISEK